VDYFCHYSHSNVLSVLDLYSRNTSPIEKLYSFNHPAVPSSPPLQLTPGYPCGVCKLFAVVPREVVRKVNMSLPFVGGWWGRLKVESFLA